LRFGGPIWCLFPFCFKLNFLPRVQKKKKKKKNKTSRKPSDFAIVCQVVYSVTSK
jgi:hypothetical protein